MGDENIKAPKEATIVNELESLKIVSQKISVLVFGERPESDEQENVTSNDKLTRMRNAIQDVVIRLREVANRLEIIE